MDKFRLEPENNRTINGNKRKRCWCWNCLDITEEENATNYIVSGLANLDFSGNKAGKQPSKF